MLRPFDADDNVEKYRTFAESFRGLAKAARKAKIICRSALRVSEKMTKKNKEVQSCVDNSISCL